MNRRTQGIEYFIKSLSTGERTAAQRLESYLAIDVEFDTNTQPGVPPIGRETFRGRDAVLEHVFGDWPATPGYSRLGWSDPIVEGDGMKVLTSSAVTVTFGFNDADDLRSVYLDGGWGSGVPAPAVVGGQSEEIPLAVKGFINNARGNQTPMVVTYVDDFGVPRSSFRGSVCVFSPTQLGIWIRDPNGGLPKALDKNPHLALVYSDLRSSGIINVLGNGHVATDEESRRKVFELGPEVEQTHDTDRRGLAVIVDVSNLQAFLGGTGYTMNKG